MSVVMRSASGGLGPGPATVTMFLRNGIAMVLPPSSLPEVRTLASALENEWLAGRPASALMIAGVALTVSDISVFSVEVA